MFLCLLVFDEKAQDVRLCLLKALVLEHSLLASVISMDDFVSLPPAERDSQSADASDRNPFMKIYTSLILLLFSCSCCLNWLARFMTAA